MAASLAHPEGSAFEAASTSRQGQPVGRSSPASRRAPPGGGIVLAAIVGGGFWALLAMLVF